MLDVCPYKEYNDCTGKEREVIQVPIKKGTKLTNNPKSVRLEIRMTKEQNEVLTECAEKMGVSKTDVLMKGVQLVRNEIKK